MKKQLLAIFIAFTSAYSVCATAGGSNNGNVHISTYTVSGTQVQQLNAAFSVDYSTDPSNQYDFVRGTTSTSPTQAVQFYAWDLYSSFSCYVFPSNPNYEAARAAVREFGDGYQLIVTKVASQNECDAIALVYNTSTIVDRAEIN